MSKKKRRTKTCPGCKGTKICGVCHGRSTVGIVHGRNKGSKFERDIAKDITDWTGIYFTRTPLSGGWAKTGDITPKDPKEMVDFPFSIECKNQEVFSTVMLVESAVKFEMSRTLSTWWKQCTDDAKKAKKIPLLVMTKAREPVYVLMRVQDFRKMKCRRWASVVFNIGWLRIMPWSEFLMENYREVRGCYE